MQRNVAKTQYGLQGWKRNKVNPDFVFAKMKKNGVAKMVVLKTKGLHLKNEDTDYKKALLSLLTSMYENTSAIRVGELAPEGAREESVVCDLVFDDARAGTVSNHYFQN